MRWESRPQDLLLRNWEDGTVVFDEADGHLHLLSPVAGQLLNLLLEKDGATAFELANGLIDAVPFDDDIQMVENVLGQFSDLHLVHRLAA